MEISEVTSRIMLPPKEVARIADMLMRMIRKFGVGSEVRKRLDDDTLRKTAVSSRRGKEVETWRDRNETRSLCTSHDDMDSDGESKSEMEQLAREAIRALVAKRTPKKRTGR